VATRSAVILAEKITPLPGGDPVVEEPRYRFRGRAVYGHWDGYPSWTGRILSLAYTDRKRAEALLAHGDFSILGPFLDPKELEAFGVRGRHTFDQPLPGVSVFYRRDREERGREAREVRLEGQGSLLRLLGEKYRKAWDAEFTYLGVPEGEVVRWYGYGALEGKTYRLFELYPPRADWPQVALEEFVKEREAE